MESVQATVVVYDKNGEGCGYERIIGAWMLAFGVGWRFVCAVAVQFFFSLL